MRKNCIGLVISNIIYILLLLTSCSLAGIRNTGTQQSTPNGDLEEVHSAYLQSSMVLERDSSGWYYGADCDGILFESLLSVGSGQPSDINAARIEPGHYYRNPSLTGCDHDISRDMLLGVYWYAWEYKRLDVAEELWEYGSANYWKMGEGDSRTVLTPGMVSLLAKLVYQLGGDSHKARYYTETQYSTEPGFQSHLTMLHILLDGELNGDTITDTQLDKLREISELMTQNPLAQAAYSLYTDGNQSVATKLLLGIWPSTRLPTSSDWCESWRTQRKDNDSGFQPCPAEHKQHSGGDLLFVLRVMGM